MSYHEQLISQVIHPDWVKDKTIYEVNLRQYTAGGTLHEFMLHLPRLKELGVGILWIMPIHPVGIQNRKGSSGSPYSVRNYTAIDPTIGSLTEFKKFVEHAHKAGMYVILDWVANHTAWDHYWTHDYPDFYERDEKGQFLPPNPDWTDVIHLDYSNKNLWKAMIHDMAFWIKECDIDGFRCDMAHLVPTLFWNEARKQLDQIKPVFMLAESENRDLLIHAFDSIYNWNIHHLINKIAQQKAGIKDIYPMLNHEIYKFPKGAIQMMFTSNHDENTWNGSAIERLHYGLEPFNVLSFTLPAIPLIYSGQEAGNFKKLSFFEKDKIDWQYDKMTPFYQQLVSLKKRNPALWNGDWGGGFYVIENSRMDYIFSYMRIKDDHQVLIILNVSGLNHSFTLYGSNYCGFYQNVFNQQKSMLYMNQTFNLDAWSYLVFEKV